MKPSIRPGRPWRRRRVLRLSVTATVLLLSTFGVAAPALGADTSGPSRIIFDLNATPSWVREYNGSGNEPDVAEDVVLASPSVAYVCGSTGTGPTSDATLMKFVDGVPAWPTPRVYNSPDNTFDEAKMLALGPGGTSVYAAGMSARPTTFNDVLVIKWKSNGTRQWARRWDGSGEIDQPLGIAVDANGNVYVAAASWSGGNYDWMLLSWTSSGTLRWAKRLSLPNGTMGIPTDVVHDGGSIYVSGYTSSGMMASPEMRTVRYTTAGKIKWSRSYRGAEGAVGSALIPRPGGGVYVAGAAMSSATGSDGLVISYTKSGARDVFTLDTGPGGLTHQRFNDVAVAANGMVVAVGSSTTGTNEDCRQVAYSSDGTIIGAVTFPGAWGDAWEAVAADAFGGFYVTGVYHVAADKTAIAVARGSVLEGGGGLTSLWQPALVTEQNRPKAIAVSGTTAVVVGQCSTSVAWGTGQIVLGYTY